jgi:hypothetical protein
MPIDTRTWMAASDMRADTLITLGIRRRIRPLVLRVRKVAASILGSFIQGCCEYEIATRGRTGAFPWRAPNWNIGLRDKQTVRVSAMT